MGWTGDEDEDDDRSEVVGDKETTLNRTTKPAAMSKTVEIELLLTYDGKGQ